MNASRIEVLSDLKLPNPVPLTRHPALVYLAGLGEGSRRTMRSSLDAIASVLTNGECDALSLNWPALSYQHTAAVRAALLQRFSKATAAKMLCALRRVLKESRRLGLMTASDYETAVDLPRIDVPQKQLKGRAVALDEIAAVMEACQNNRPIDIRDLALVAILCGAGLRRGELVKLQLKDYKKSTGALEVRDGKRGKDRTVYLPESALPLVEQWLSLRGSEPGPLICPVRKGGVVQLRPMTSDAVFKILNRRARQAEIEAFSPHDMRRTFCTNLLAAGIDVLTVQKLAGHSSPLTTARYDRRGEETKRRAVQKLEIPVSRS